MVDLEYFDDEDIERFLKKALEENPEPKNEQELKRAIEKAFGTPRGKNISGELTRPANLTKLFDNYRRSLDPQEALAKAEDTGTRIETLEERRDRTRDIEQLDAQIEAQRGELAEQLNDIEDIIRRDSRSQIQSIRLEVRRLRREV